MAYKIVNKTQLDYDLERIADAIRSKGSAFGRLTFPDGMINAINNLTFSSLNSISIPDHVVASGNANYQLVNADILDGYITQVTNTLRNKTGYSEKLSFPNGIIGVINAMSEKASLVYVSGTYVFNNTTNPEISGYWTGKMYSSNSTDSTTVYALVNSGYGESRFNEIRLNAPGNAEYWDLLLYDTADDFMPAYDSNYHGFPATITFPPCYIDAELWNSLGNVLSYQGGEPIYYITFWYDGSEYQVAPGTTWEEFADSGQASSLSTKFMFDDYYVYDYAHDSFVGTYETNAPVKADDAIIEYQNYYYGFEPGGNKVKFYIDGESYEVEEGTTWQEWVESGNSPGYTIKRNAAGFMYVHTPNGLIGYVSDISNGDYYAAISAEEIIQNDDYTSYMQG